MAFWDVESRDMAAGDLITRTEYVTGIGEAVGDVTVPQAAQIDQAITFVSDFLRDYLDRRIGIDTVTETRTYEYDGSGYLDIDDAVDITSVAFSHGTIDTPLDGTQWRAQPSGADIFTYLVLPTEAGGFSPEMGFERNLDVVWREGRFLSLPSLVKVTATFGWPDVPGPVKQATILTVQSFISEDPEFQGETTFGYSYNRRQQQVQSAISDRAKDLLEPYVRRA